MWLASRVASITILCTATLESNVSSRSNASDLQPFPERPESPYRKRSNIPWSEASQPQVRAALSNYDLWRALADWAVDQDAFISNKIDLMPATDGVNNRIVAAENIEAREVVIDIPVKLHLGLMPDVPMSDKIAFTQEDWQNISELKYVMKSAAFLTWLTIAMEENLNSSHPFWALYLEKLRRDKYSHMPYWQNQTNLGIFAPSPEHWMATNAHRWYDYNHAQINSILKRNFFVKFERSGFINVSLSLFFSGAQ